jgi:hypothetical protein
MMKASIQTSIKLMLMELVQTETAVFYVENSMGITVLKNLLTWTG